MAIQEPVLGRHVNYVLGESSKNVGQIRTSVVSLVHDVVEEEREANPGLCNLSVYIGTEFDIPNQSVSPGTNVWLIKAVKHDASKKPGTWHWPEHVAAQQKKPDPKADPAK